MVAHKPSIIWSPEALDDIDRLWEYYAGIAAPIRTYELICPTRLSKNLIFRLGWLGAMRLRTIALCLCKIVA